MTQEIHTPRHTEAWLHEMLLTHANRQVSELERKQSDALETMLSLYLLPDAFAVLKRFHREFDEACGGRGFTFLNALNELGGCAGVAGLQQTLRRVKKEQGAV